MGGDGGGGGGAVEWLGRKQAGRERGRIHDAFTGCGKNGCCETSWGEKNQLLKKKSVEI